MTRPGRRGRLAALATCAVVTALVCGCSGYGPPGHAGAQLEFGVDMARHGLWSEALFRFREAARLDPQNPRILSDIAVAHEALGQFDDALQAYQQALRLAPGDREIKRNYSRFAEFYQSYTKSSEQEPSQESSATTGSSATPGAESTPPPSSPPPPRAVGGS